MTDAVLVALIALGAPLIGAVSSFFTIGKGVKKGFKKLEDKVDNLSAYIKNEKDDEEIRKKMEGIQAYYINKMDGKLKPVAVMKSDSFIGLIVDFGLGLNLDDINDYTKFQDHLFSGAKYCRVRMAQLIGEELTEKYYITHEANTIRFNKVVQKIFFTTDNSKRQRFVAASVDFMQLFMTEMACLKNGNHKDEMNEEKQHSRRCEDHI